MVRESELHLKEQEIQVPKMEKLFEEVSVPGFFTQPCLTLNPIHILLFAVI